MGLFTQKPQFNDEAPSLPGEPLDPETVAERLPERPSDAAPAHIADLTEGVTSITIPLTPGTPPAQ